MRNLIKILVFIVFVLSLAGCGTNTASLNPVNSEIQQMSQASTAMSSPAKGEVTSVGAIVDRFNFMEPIDEIITNPCTESFNFISRNQTPMRSCLSSFITL
jgi:hypothetical protein